MADAPAANEAIAPEAANDNPSSVPEGEGENPDQDEYSLTDSDAEGVHAFRHAAPEYRIRWARLHNKTRDRKRRIQELNARIIELEAENRRLAERIVRLRQPGNTLRKTQVVRSLRKFENFKRLCFLTNQRSRLGQLSLAMRVGEKSTKFRAWREMLRPSSKNFIRT